MKKTLLTLLLIGAVGFLSPKSNAQTYYPSLDSKVNPFKQPNQSKPLVWDDLSKAQKESLLKQYLAEDKTDEIAYVPGKFESGNFARQLNINFYGTSGYQIVPGDASFIYDQTNVEKFNIPLYFVNRSSSTGGHGMNAILIGDNPLNWNDWAFVEPQTDAIVQPGSQSIPLNSTIEIKQNYWYYDSAENRNSLFGKKIVSFDVSNGVPSLVSYDLERLVTEKNPVPNSAPEAFDLASPEDNASISSCTVPINFSWSKSVDKNIEDTVKYEEKIKNIDTGNETVVQDISDTSYTIAPGILQKGNYEWSVSANDGEETTYSNNTRRFSIRNTPPTAPSFIVPTENDTAKYNSGKLLVKYTNDATDADHDPLTSIIRISNGSDVDTSFSTSAETIELDSKIFKPSSRYTLEGKITDGTDTVDYTNSGMEFFTPKVTGVERLPGQLPNKASLEQNYPNPFNPVTRIRYSLKKTEDVSLKIYDALGREVKTLVNSHMPGGHYEVDFDASKLSSGVYFYRIKAGDFTETKKMVVNK